MQTAQLQDQHYILATTTLADERTRVLKHGDTFAVFDRYGDIEAGGLHGQGIYHEGTRFLSALLFQLNGARPLILNSTVRDDNDMLLVDLTNTDVCPPDCSMIPRGTIYISRSKFLWEGCCYERLRISNYGLHPVELSFSYLFEADFADIFEVRGTRRKQKGNFKEPVIRENTVFLFYEGLDQVIRETKLIFSPAPKNLTENSAAFDLRLDPHQEATFFLTVSARTGDEKIQTDYFENAFHVASASLKASRDYACSISSSKESFNHWLNRSLTDLHMMITETPKGKYPYAGVPWFSVPFGRDGILTAIEMLWIDPSLAKGVLNYLSAHQAKELDPENDAEPGKILHETRKGEMAALKEIPFGLYYGSVDATPLFVMLAGFYLERTGDLDFIREIFPNIEAALKWIDTYGDKDGDGFVEYARCSSSGLIHQGWKDSGDAIFHSNGEIAHAPIALCEVQGYVYQAKRQAAFIASQMGDRQKASELIQQSEILRKKFLEKFWCEQIGTYALALDGEKKPCRVRSSNAGHCLFTEIASPEHARVIAEGLLRDEFFTGWGIRTVSACEARYNPMSYHNGSVWPHDNALIAYGLALYGFKELALKVLTGLFEASTFLELHRMPELFCGFARRNGQGPTLYPVACAPQSWATASIFYILQACLGLSIKASESQLRFSHPALPPFLKQIQISHLQVGEGSVDLLLERQPHSVALNILRRKGHVEVNSIK